MKKVTVVELSVYENIMPLVSGYLEAFAFKDDILKSNYSFDNYSSVATRKYEEIFDSLIDKNSDVYAFSCYVWNISLVKRLVHGIKKEDARLKIVLGGPQVMNEGGNLGLSLYKNLFICNGEGEVTFSELLRVGLSDTPDYRLIKGISFFDKGELITTEGQPRIKDLNEIPSPFLNNVFSSNYSIAMIETNRGCPFRCGFCYWGAATNDKVIQFDEERVKQEFEYLSKKGIVFLYIVDANWGQSKRDIGLTKALASYSESNGSPNMIYFSAAKNSVERVTEITKTLKSSGLIASQPVSMQTLSENSLRLIERENIKLSTYSSLQTSLKDEEMCSFVELIWPLPGETLTTYKKGVNDLCLSGADTIITYPHLLLKSTPIYKNKDKYGFTIRDVEDGVSEGEVVVGTSSVSYEEFCEGMLFFYSLHSLHNTRSLYRILKFLSGNNYASYQEVVASFAKWCLDSGDNIFSFFCNNSISTTDYYNVFNYGKLIHHVLHSCRDEFNDLLIDFVQSQPWWEIEDVRILFEIDLISKPFIYSNTGFSAPVYGYKYINILDVSKRKITAWLCDEAKELYALSSNLDVHPEELVSNNGIYQINHHRKQFPFMTSQGLDHNAGYCHGMIEKIENIMPQWLPDNEVVI